MHGKVKKLDLKLQIVRSKKDLKLDLKAAGCSSDPAGSRLSVLGPVVEASPTLEIGVVVAGHRRWRR